MSRRRSLRLVPSRFDDEASGGSDAARARARDQKIVDTHPPLPREPAHVVEDEIDELDE